MQDVQKARFDTKLSKAQKDFFEYAASIGGYRSLTDFIVASAQEKANLIVEQNTRIVLSKSDQEIFFNEIINPSKPNKTLIEAANRYFEFKNSK